MLELLVIAALGLIPLLLSALGLRRAQQRWQTQLQQIQAQTSLTRRAAAATTPVPELDWNALGDRRCRYNARSPYLRCAVNPSGPCQGCPHYQPRWESPGAG